MTERLEEIRLRHGEMALPLNRAKAGKAKWKAVVKMTMLKRSFLPSYPSTLGVDGVVFCRVFPFHFVVDRALKIVRGLQGINLVGMDLVEVAPSYDHAEITSLAGATLALEMLYVLGANKGA